METKENKSTIINNEIKVEKKTEAKIMKIGLSLDSTIQVVTDLFTRARHRSKMLAYVQNLSEFEIEQKEESLEDERYSYRGCILNIKDDHGKEFALKNPVLIFEVVKFLGIKFQDKISEIEANIILP
jgi:hypothetical protein